MLRSNRRLVPRPGRFALWKCNMGASVRRPAPGSGFPRRGARGLEGDVVDLNSHAESRPYPSRVENSRLGFRNRGLEAGTRNLESEIWNPENRSGRRRVTTALELGGLREGEVIADTRPV